jgi:hypothetical protein
MTPTASVEAAHERLACVCVTPEKDKFCGTVGAVVSAGGADGSVEVLADAEFADSFCAASNADTVYEYEVDAVRPVSV